MPKFRTIADYAASGALVRPLFYQFTMDPGTTISLNLRVSKPEQRAPDGWFHASAHPLTGERDLYLWMTGQLRPEEMDYVSRMSVMFGSMAHAYVEGFLEWMKASVPLPPSDCPACGRPHREVRQHPSERYCTEHGFSDPLTRARCHLDAILKFGDELWGFDFKTIYQFGLKNIKDLDGDAFKEKWPHYWAQMQECMRLSGLRQYIVFFLTMGVPWETREFHIPFDPDFAAQTEEKYLAVLSHVQRKVPIIA